MWIFSGLHLCFTISSISFIKKRVWKIIIKSHFYLSTNRSSSAVVAAAKCERMAHKQIKVFHISCSLFGVALHRFNVFDANRRSDIISLLRSTPVALLTCECKLSTLHALRCAVCARWIWCACTLYTVRVCVCKKRQHQR